MNDIKEYKPYMGENELTIGEKLIFKYRTIENVIFMAFGTIHSFGMTNDGIRYLEAEVEDGKKSRIKKFVI